MSSASISNRVLPSLLAAICAVWLIAWGLIWCFLPDLQARGQFGDLFGSVNALFSGLAFATLLYTIFQQRHLLELQQEQLQAQMQALQLQQDAAKASAVEIKSQAEAQRALYRATAAQVRVASIKALIEYEQFERSHIEVSVPGGHNSGEAHVKELLGRLEKLAIELEVASGA